MIFREKPAGARLYIPADHEPLLSRQPEMADRVRPLTRQANDNQINKSIQQEICAQVKIWKLQAYFVYSKTFKAMSCA